MSTSAPSRAGTSIRVGRVSKSFARADSDRQQVLQHVSLDVEPGEILGIIGRSGAGKSTLLRIICGLLSPDSGDVSIGSQSADAARRSKHIAFMPQSPALLPWLSVRQNVALVERVNPKADVGAHSTDDRVADALVSVGLREVMDSFPRELSGGMQHRVALARAMAVGAPVLALDEPFGSLDEITRAGLYDLVLNGDAGRQPTIVLVTHNLDEAVLLSDRVVVLGGTPGTIRGVVSVGGRRPRRAAIESGAYRDVLALVRSLLEGGDEGA